MSSLDPSAIARIQCNELRQYLVPFHARPLAERRSVSRQKLSRLTEQQFQELTSDVYDDLIRRKRSTPENNIPCLPLRDEFHPKRNQARQKLATLANTRFEDLSSDVYFELSRRHPELNEEDDVGEHPSTQELPHGYIPSPDDVGERPSIQKLSYDYIPSPGFKFPHWPDTSSGSQVTLISEEKGMDGACGSHTPAPRPLEDKLAGHPSGEGACDSGANHRGIGSLTMFFQYIARGTQRIKMLGQCRLRRLKPWLSFWKGNVLAQKNNEKVYGV